MVTHKPEHSQRKTLQQETHAFPTIMIWSQKEGMGAYKHGPLSSWPAIKRETPNGRDCKTSTGQNK